MSRRTAKWRPISRQSARRSRQVAANVRAIGISHEANYCRAIEFDLSSIAVHRFSRSGRWRLMACRTTKYHPPAS